MGVGVMLGMLLTLLHRKGPAKILFTNCVYFVFTLSNWKFSLCQFQKNFISKTDSNIFRKLTANVAISNIFRIKELTNK